MTLVVTRKDVESLLDIDGGKVLDDLIERTAAAYGEYAAGTVDQHPRVYLRSRSDPARRPKGLFSMSALLPQAGIMGTRLLALGGRGPGGDALLVLFDYQKLECLALINDHPTHRYRTGAPASLATRALAKPDAKRVAVIGSSGIAWGTLAMCLRVRPGLRQLRVFSPNPDHREKLAREAAQKFSLEASATEGPEHAVDGADIVIVSTDADRPVIPDSAITPGMHINLMARNEIASASFARSHVVVSSIAIHRALDPPWREAIPEHAIKAELADLLAGKRQVRTSPSDITVFCGSGPLAMWDVAAASAFYEAAKANGLGLKISLDG